VGVQGAEQLGLRVAVVAHGGVQLVDALARQHRRDVVDERAGPPRLDVEVRPREAEDDRHLVLAQEHRVGLDAAVGVAERDDHRAAPGAGA
jgi:hypothetical protein